MMGGRRGAGQRVSVLKQAIVAPSWIAGGLLLHWERLQLISKRFENFCYMAEWSSAGLLHVHDDKQLSQTAKDGVIYICSTTRHDMTADPAGTETVHF